MSGRRKRLVDINVNKREPWHLSRIIVRIAVVSWLPILWRRGICDVEGGWPVSALHASFFMCHLTDGRRRRRGHMRERIRSEGEKGRTEGETRLREVDTEGVPTVVRTSEELGTDWPLRMPGCDASMLESTHRLSSSSATPRVICLCLPCGSAIVSQSSPGARRAIPLCTVLAHWATGHTLCLSTLDLCIVACCLLFLLLVQVWHPRSPSQPPSSCLAHPRSRCLAGSRCLAISPRSSKGASMSLQLLVSSTVSARTPECHSEACGADLQERDMGTLRAGQTICQREHASGRSSEEGSTGSQHSLAGGHWATALREDDGRRHTRRDITTAGHSGHETRYGRVAGHAHTAGLAVGGRDGGIREPCTAGRRVVQAALLAGASSRAGSPGAAVGRGEAGGQRRAGRYVPTARQEMKRSANRRR